MTNWPILPSEIKTQKFKEFGLTLYDQMFGALSQDENNHLSRVAVANSSFSIDPSVGCPMGCAYCVAGSNKRDAGINNGVLSLKEILPKNIKTIFLGKDLIHALHTHPAFIPNESVISISTGSSEPFLGCNSKNTWDILEYLIDNNLHNPVWIVSKAGIPIPFRKEWKKRFEKLSLNKVPIIISLTYSGLPSTIEPFKGNRVESWVELKDTGIKLSHHLRPIIRGVNDNRESVLNCLSATLPVVENVCIGGLRLDPGIVLAWKFVNNLPTDILPSKPGVKDIPEGFEELVLSCMKEIGIVKPIFSRSSEMISTFLGKKDFNLYQYRKNINKKDLLLRVPVSIQKKAELKTGKVFLKILEQASERVGLKNILDFQINDDEIILINSDALTYQTERVFIHSLGHMQIL